MKLLNIFFGIVIATGLLAGCKKDGPAGPIGPTGAEGPQGPAGPAGQSYSAIVDSFNVTSSDWHSLGNDSYNYVYINDSITQTVVDKGLIEVASFYAPNWIVWPFVDQYGTTYTFSYSLHTIVLSIYNEHLNTGPDEKFKIVIGH